MIGAPMPLTPPAGATVSQQPQTQTGLSACRLLLDFSLHSRLSGLSCLSLWYSLGMDLIGNTASHNSYIFAWCHYRCRPTEFTIPSSTSIGHAAWRDVFHYYFTLYCVTTYEWLCLQFSMSHYENQYILINESYGNAVWINKVVTQYHYLIHLI
jgi:hypothetical protein